MNSQSTFREGVFIMYQKPPLWMQRCDEKTLRGFERSSVFCHFSCFQHRESPPKAALQKWALFWLFRTSPSPSILKPEALIRSSLQPLICYTVITVLVLSWLLAIQKNLANLILKWCFQLPRWNTKCKKWGRSGAQWFNVLGSEWVRFGVIYICYITYMSYSCTCAEQHIC